MAALIASFKRRYTFSLTADDIVWLLERVVSYPRLVRLHLLAQATGYEAAMALLEAASQPRAIDDADYQAYLLRAVEAAQAPYRVTAADELLGIRKVLEAALQQQQPNDQGGLEAGKPTSACVPIRESQERQQQELLGDCRVILPYVLAMPFAQTLSQAVAIPTNTRDNGGQHDVLVDSISFLPAEEVARAHRIGQQMEAVLYAGAPNETAEVATEETPTRAINMIRNEDLPTSPSLETTPLDRQRELARQQALTEVLRYPDSSGLAGPPSEESAS